MVSPKDAFNDLARGRGNSTTDDPRVLEVLIQGASAHVIRKLQLSVLQTVTFATPVDTGHARSGWTPNVGSPVVNRLGRPLSETTARTAASKRLAANRARAKAIAESYLIQNGPVFLSNAVPYVVFLDQGSSAQAAANFVARAIVTSIVAIGARQV